MGVSPKLKSQIERWSIKQFFFVFWGGGGGGGESSPTKELLKAGTMYCVILVK